MIACIQISHYVAVPLTVLVSVRPISNDKDETVLSLINFRDVTTQEHDVTIGSGVTSSLVDETGRHLHKLSGSYSFFF